MLNVVTITGRLVEAPELRRTANDLAVTTIRIAVKRDYAKDADVDSDFFDVVAWRGTAEFVTKHFDKGSMITVVGRLQNRSWVDKNEQKRVSAEIIADHAYFGDSKAKNKDNDNDSSSNPLDDESTEENAPAENNGDFSPFD